MLGHTFMSVKRLKFIMLAFFFVFGEKFMICVFLCAIKYLFESLSNVNSLISSSFFLLFYFIPCLLISFHEIVLTKKIVLAAMLLEHGYMG